MCPATRTPAVTFWVLFLLSSNAHAQAVSPITGEPLPPKRLHVQLDNSTVDDHLIQLSRQANVNFIADASRFPKETQTVSIDSENSLGNLILEMAAQRKLTWTKQGPNTFLFWTDWQGDLRDLAKMIIAQEQTRLDKIRAFDTGLLAEEQARLAQARTPEERTRVRSASGQEARWNQEMLPDLLRYFHEVHGWDGKNENLKLKVSIADLPADLRAKVIARAQEELAGRQLLTDADYFNDVFWKQAVLADGGPQSDRKWWWSKLLSPQDLKRARGFVLQGPAPHGMIRSWMFGWYLKPQT